MSNRRTHTAPRNNEISEVIVDTSAMMPDGLKYPNGFVTNILLVNKPLLEQAAQEIGVQIQFAAPRGGANPNEFEALYVQDTTRVRALLNRLTDFIIARAMQRSDSHA